MSTLPLYQRSRHRNRVSQRSGTAAAELAVCLPVLVTILLATTEACHMLHLQQSLKICAFEGARVGTVPGAKIENVTQQCETWLNDDGVQSYSIAMKPADPSTLKQGDYFEVTISADYATNSLIGGWLYRDRVLSRSAALSAE